MTTENYFYLDYSNQPVGPVELSALTALASGGLITGETLVAKVGASEWVPLSSVVATSAPTPESAAPVAAAQSGKPVLLPQAYAIAQKAKLQTSEFDQTAKVEFPGCSGGFFSNHNAFFRSVYMKGNDGQLLKSVGSHVLYVTVTRKSLVSWEYATLSGGASLELRTINTEFLDQTRVAHLIISEFGDTLVENMNTGLRIRVSSPSEGEEEIITINPADIQAVLFYQDADAFTYGPEAGKAAVVESSFLGQVDSFNNKLGMFLWAFCSWIFAGNAVFGILHLLGGKIDGLYQFLLTGSLAAPYFIYKHLKKKKAAAAATEAAPTQA